MARTGIDIQINNTRLGGSPEVNSNSMLVVFSAAAVPGATTPFTLETAFMLYSPGDLANLGITEDNNPAIYRQVNDYYSQAPGSLLWLVGFAGAVSANEGHLVEVMPSIIRSTVVSGFQYRPRQILFSPGTNMVSGGPSLTTSVQEILTQMYVEGFSMVAISGSTYGVALGGVNADPAGFIDSLTGAGDKPLVGFLIITNRPGTEACVGLIGGLMASLPVGTSIGNTNLSALGSMYIMDVGSGTDVINTPCAELSLATCNLLGDAQLLFARTRPPRNGLWMNDGATLADSATALSTLEAGRTIAAIVDSLRDYFVSYLNTNMPVALSGDLDPNFRQVLINGARAAVITPRIDAGDITDAEISIRAMNNDFVGTRTLECTVRILPAPSLRWVDGYVFYVNALN